ncbi:hemerythrin domain-containing protein [Pendulispora brunnea]|uniref:Hemerythrin domain-containing protein n=1 Tax=Pendulispora brunnea TaxID=2905690 RepID=A0ABZ2KDG5_9BACT
MKATDLLEQQHRKVEDVFDKLKNSKSNASALLEELANDLSAHMAIEQNIFYPAVREVDSDTVEESLEEHSMAEIALKRLLRTPVTDPSFEAKLTTLEELIEHHVEEEEEELFPEVEEKLGADKLDTLGRQMEKAFEQAKAEGFNALVPQGLSQTSADESRKIASQMKAPTPNGAVAQRR